MTRLLSARAAQALYATTAGAMLALFSACATPPAPTLSPAKLEQFRSDALRAWPPDEQGEFRADDLVEVIRLDPTLQLDVRYASANNFLRAAIYPEARVFLQRPAAEAVVRANAALRTHGYGLRLFDGYRPWYVTQLFWDATPAEQRAYVADPAKGSRHNRGSAVDLTLYDLRTGLEVSMPSGYDDFTERAHPDFTGGTPEQRAARDLLRRVMEAEGFTVYENEWWHFDHRDWTSYRIGNTMFKDLPRLD
jgi:D-alanyl-D-alanine dipeptidase